jgi:hypothetical protein
MNRSGSKVFVSLIVVVLLTGAAFSTAGCGSSDDDVQQAVDQALAKQREADRQRRLEREQRQLKRELHRLKRKSGRSSKSSGSSSSTTSCGDGISVNSATTCPFARNVADTFRGSGPGSISVWSPVTERYYEMNCTSGSPTVCTGGNNARVTIR